VRPAPEPHLTIAVPTLGARESLVDCLARLATAAQPLRALGPVALLVADGGGTEVVTRALAQVRDDFDAVRRLPVPVGVSHARNALADAATGEWIVYVDDDVLVRTDTLEHLLADAKPETVVAGQVDGLGHFGGLSELGRIGRDGFGDPVLPGGDPDYVVSALMVLPVELAQRVRWHERFAAPYCDDLVWSLRLLDAGVRLRLSVGARAWHPLREFVPPAEVAGFAGYVALERWRPEGRARAAGAWTLCTAKSVWAYRGSPREMATAGWSCAKVLAGWLADH
jgi:GT2 family glycosyltransferase